MLVMNFELQIFDPDHHAKIRLRLSITVLEKKIKTDSRVNKNGPDVVVAFVLVVVVLEVVLLFVVEVLRASGFL